MTKKPLFKKVLPPSGAKKAEIIWLHGWGQSHEGLIPLAGLFTRGFKNTLYDLPGFGQSPRLGEGAGTGIYARAMIAELEKTRPAGVILAGHSFGCRVAIRMAAMRPDLVSAMVLISAAGLKRKRGPGFRLKSFLLKLLGKLAGASDAVFETDFKGKFRTRFGSRDYRQAGALRATFVKTVNEDLSGIAQTVSCPVLLLYGQLDTETPPEFGQRYAGLIPGAQLRILPGFGHLDILTAGRYQCQHYLAQFLGELEESWKA